MFENKPKKSESKWYYDRRVGFGKYGVRLARLFFFLSSLLALLHSTTVIASFFSVCVEKRLANDLTVIIDFRAMTIFLHRPKRRQSGMCKNQMHRKTALLCTASIWARVEEMRWKTATTMMPKTTDTNLYHCVKRLARNRARLTFQCPSTAFFIKSALWIICI